VKRYLILFIFLYGTTCSSCTTANVLVCPTHDFCSKGKFEKKLSINFSNQSSICEEVFNTIYIVFLYGTTCSSCTTANVLLCPTHGFCSKGKRCMLHDTRISNIKTNKACPLCTALRNAIWNKHWYRRLSWKNTYTRRWWTDAYQITKCYNTARRLLW
jgi:hypothetical protein